VGWGYGGCRSPMKKPPARAGRRLCSTL